MTPAEKISLLDLDIKKIEIDLARVGTYLTKMKDLRHEEAIKLGLIEGNVTFLKQERVVVLLNEYKVIDTAKRQQQQTLQLMDAEIAKTEGGYLLHKKNCDKMILDRETLLKQNRKGIVLQFKRD